MEEHTPGGGLLGKNIPRYAREEHTLRYAKEDPILRYVRGEQTPDRDLLGKNIS